MLPTSPMEAFAAAKRVFRCPLCKGKLSFTPKGSLVCKQKHSFDLSGTGYVNFIATGKSLYSATLFAHRRCILQSGFYNPVLEAVHECIRRRFPQGGVKVLDIGCGDGFYASSLSREERMDVYALDNVKEAIQLAAKSFSPVKWMVANLADIPLRDSTMDVLLDILTPANYTEFQRLLTDRGILIKVIPGKQYLQQVRTLARDQLQHKEYSDEETRSYFHAHMRYLTEREVCYTLPVTPEQAKSFLEMTPMTFGVDTSQLDASAIKEITIHMTVLIGQKLPKK